MKKNYVPGCPCPDCIKVFTTRIRVLEPHEWGWDDPTPTPDYLPQESS